MVAHLLARGDVDRLAPREGSGDSRDEARGVLSGPEEVEDAGPGQLRPGARGQGARDEEGGVLGGGVGTHRVRGIALDERTIGGRVLETGPHAHELAAAAREDGPGQTRGRGPPTP